MNVVVFEDAEADRLAPATSTRPAFAVSCGGCRLIDLVYQLELPVHHIVRPTLRGIQQADFPQPQKLPPAGADSHVLLINARLVPSCHALAALKRLIKAGQTGIVMSGTSIAAAVVGASEQWDPRQLDFASLRGLLDALPPDLLEVDLPLLELPHDIVRYHQEIFGDNLAARIGDGTDYQQTRDGVFLAAGAKIADHVVTDTHDGPIVLDENATVEAFSYLKGPLHLAHGAKVVNHASIKSHVAAGHATKLGGEISCSIIEPYSNKSHHGFLGHSYLGSWINLGAGTTNSNLKNTYGMIEVDYDGQKVATGMQFLGCVVGDYTKTAINTSIFAGKMIGVNSMLYGMVTENVPAFVNYARALGEATEVSVAAAAKMQASMFARRGLTPRPADVELLQAVFDMTAGQRKAFDPRLASGPLSLRAKSR